LSSPPPVDFSKFLKLVDKPENAQYIKKINFQGTRRVVVELDYDRKPKEGESVPAVDEALRHELHGGNKFTTVIWALEDQQLSQKLDALAAQGVKMPVEDDHTGWISSAIIFFVLPAALLLGVFLFILPRFRDPLVGRFLSNYIKSPAKRYDK